MTEATKSKSSNGNGEQFAIAEDVAVLQEAFGRLIEPLKLGTLEGASGQARRLAAQADHSTKLLAHQVEVRPLTSVLIAFGVGLIGGRLLSR